MPFVTSSPISVFQDRSRTDDTGNTGDVGRRTYVLSSERHTSVGKGTRVRTEDFPTMAESVRFASTDSTLDDGCVFMSARNIETRIGS